MVLLTHLCQFVYQWDPKCCVQPDGHYVEWKAEEVLNLESQSDQDWAVIGSVSFKNEREGDTSEWGFLSHFVFKVFGVFVFFFIFCFILFVVVVWGLLFFF